MKILSLLEAQYQTQIKTTKSKRDVYDLWKTFPMDKKIGNGLYYTALNTKDPHMIKKVSNTSIQHDAYYEFITYIIENKLQDNPHFPRIYNVKKIQNKYNQSVYSFEIEKLIPLKSISDDELLSWLHNNIHNNFYVENYKYKHSDIINIITETVSIAIEYVDKADKIILDQTLINACKILNKIENELNLSFDLHDGNFMFRRTSFGLQLVITDPFT